MKRIVTVGLLLMFPLSGCALLKSDAAYNAEAAKWKAMGDAAKAYNDNYESKLVEVNPDTGIVTVYNQNQSKPIQVTEGPNPWVEGLKTVVNSTPASILAGGWAAGTIADKTGSDYMNSGDGDFASNGSSINNSTSTQISENPESNIDSSKSNIKNENAGNDYSSRDSDNQNDSGNTDVL